jgi:hypothetical protein
VKEEEDPTVVVVSQYMYVVLPALKSSHRV